MPSKSANVKNEKQYEALKDKGMSKERAARIANSPGASSRGGKASGSGKRSSNSSQGGTTAQKKSAGRKGGKATAKKNWHVRRIGSARLGAPPLRRSGRRASPEVRDALERAPPLNIFRMMANAETAFRPWLRWGAALLSRPGARPAAARAGDPAGRAPHAARRVRVGAARRHRQGGRRHGRAGRGARARRHRGRLLLRRSSSVVLGFTTEVVRDARASRRDARGARRRCCLRARSSSC